MPSPYYDTTTVPGVRILDGSSDGRDIDKGFESLAVDLKGIIDNRASSAGSFSAYRSAALSVSNNGVVTFDTEEFDVSSWYDVSNGRFTPQVAGVYRLSTRLSASAELVDMVQWQANVLKNGSILKSLDLAVQWSTVGTAPPPCSFGSVLVSANGSSDYFQVAVAHSVGSAQALQVGQANAYFQGELVGRT